MDVICDHKPSAQTKLANASLCLQTKGTSYGSESVFDSSVSTISPETRNIIENGSKYWRESLESDPEIEVIEVNSNNYGSIECEDCGHNTAPTLWDLKKKFRRNDANDSEDYIQEMARNMTQSSFDGNDYKGVLELFFAKMEVDLQKILIKENDSKYILKQINDMFKNSFESYATNVLKQKIEELLSDYRLEELHQNCDYYKSLKFKILETIARIQVQIKEFKDAINTCNQMNCLNASTYEQRVIHSNLLYFEAFSKLELYKTKHNIKGDRVWVEYNSLLDVSPYLESRESQSITPTRPQTKIKGLVPKAPKQKPYINDEYEDYVTALSNRIYDECKANASNPSNDKNPFRMKSTLKLNLENDSEVRSVSITESNLTTNETIGHMITSEASKRRPFVKTTTITERMTRSRASSLKVITKCLDSEVKVEKESKRSTAKSSKIKSDLSEIIDLTEDLNQELEDLDEVFFDKLTLNEKKSYEENELSLESIIAILERIFDLMASHPTSKLYVSVHKLLVQIYSISDQTNKELIGYHFSESVRSTYRYRNLFIAEKKRKLNKSSKYDLNSIFFSANDMKENNSSKIFTDCLPTDWRIIQIMGIENETKIPELMVCRYQNGKTPVYLRIKSDPQKVWQI